MRHLNLLLVVALLAGVCVAQEARTTPPPDPAKLVEELGSEEFKVREAATAALRVLGEKARAALEIGVLASNLERKTRAKGLLGELDQPGRRDRPDLESKIEKLRRQLRGERLRPVTPPPPTAPKPEQRPQRRPLRFDELPELNDFDRIRDYQRALRQFMEEMTRVRVPAADPLEELLRSNRTTIPLNGLASTSRMSVDGKTLQLTKNRDGSVKFEILVVDPKTREVTPEVYGAKSLEEFREKHADVWEKYRDSGLFDQSRHGFRFTWPGIELRGGSVPLARPRRTLGVVVGPVPASLRAHLDLPPRAVIVEEVRPGTSAQAMGLKPHDIITHVDGQAVGSADEVRQRVTAEDAPSQINLRVLRRGEARVIQGDRPQGR